jgi:hypothetical protein
MPYKIVLLPTGGYKVKKNQPGRPKYFSIKPLTKSMAIKQLQAILISERKLKG